MHAIVKILPVNYILKGNSSKFSTTNNLCYTVTLNGVNGRISVDALNVNQNVAHDHHSVARDSSCVVQALKKKEDF